MTARKLMIRAVASIFVGFFSACADRHDGSRAQHPCTATIRGEVLFIGTRDCLAKLPPIHLSGIWVLGHEDSRFYESATTVPSKTDQDAWLEGNAENILEKSGIEWDGQTHAYKIEFIGTKSDVPGVYGHAGVFKRAVLVIKALSVKQILDEDLNSRS